MDFRADEAFHLIDIDRFLERESSLTSMFRSGQDRRDAGPAIRWLVCDNFLKQGVAPRLSADFPSTMARAGKDPAIAKKHKHVLRKIGVRDVRLMSDLQQDFFREIQRPTFLAALQRITGIAPLYADPDLEGGGLHEIYRGGYLNVHTDFNFHPTTKRLRKLNILLYLNDGWDEAWQGNLELWNHDVTSMVGSIAPIMNRMALFETSETSFHGHPHPLQSPDHVTRRSLAAYYYTDWPGQLQPRSKTNYRLVPTQIAAVRARITECRTRGLSDPAILKELSAEYQEGSLRTILKDFPGRQSPLARLKSLFSAG